MSTRVVNLRDFSQELAGFTEAHIEKQKEALRNGLARSVSDLVAASPVDTGLYAASWDFTETEFGAIIGNHAPHAPIIEYGARPFTPPIKPLLEWAKRVLKDSSQPPNYSKRVWGLAKATQRKIQEKGIEPRAVMEKTIPKIIDNIRQEFEAIR